MPTPPSKISKILPFLYLGNYLDACDISALHARRITKILNVSESVKYLEDPSFVVRHVPISDLGDTALEKQLPSCLEFIGSAKASGDGILVHCRYGQNRSPCVVLAYLTTSEGMSLKDAFMHVIAARPMVAVHEDYLVQLQKLEREVSGNVTLDREEVE